MGKIKKDIEKQDTNENNEKEKEQKMKKYFISIEITNWNDETIYYTRLANEAALKELRKTKVKANEWNIQSFGMVANTKEVTDEEIATLKKFNLDNISIGDIFLLDKNGVESELPFDYCGDSKDELLNYVPEAE